MYLQLGTKLKIGKKNGVPAHVIVSILIDIVLNLSAEYH